MGLLTSSTVQQMIYIHIHTCTIAPLSILFDGNREHLCSCLLNINWMKLCPVFCPHLWLCLCLSPIKINGLQQGIWRILIVLTIFSRKHEIYFEFHSNKLELDTFYPSSVRVPGMDCWSLFWNSNFWTFEKFLWFGGRWLPVVGLRSLYK